MSALPPALTYNLLYTDAHQSIMKFLDDRDLLVNYALLNRVHKDRVDKLHKATLTTIETASHVANDFFASIRSFSKLTDLKIRGADFQPLEMPYGHGKIDHLTFEGEWPHEITSQQILMFLEAIPNLRKLTINLAGSTVLFQPHEGERLSEAAKNNLSNLASLNISLSKIHAQGLLEILQSSTNFTSVNLIGQMLTSAMLTELVRSKGLIRLNLLGGSNPSLGGLNFEILAACTSLESFAPSRQISEEALISIIKANPNLTFLDLKSVSDAVLTDRVLKTIEEHLPRLEKLDMVRRRNSANDGFLPLPPRLQPAYLATRNARTS